MFIIASNQILYILHDQMSKISLVLHHILKRISVYWIQIKEGVHYSADANYWMRLVLISKSYFVKPSKLFGKVICKCFVLLLTN